MEQTSPHRSEAKWSDDLRSSDLRYERELLRGYMETGAVRFFLDQTCTQTGKPMLLTGKGPRGKTAALNAWTPVSGRKLVVNCAADERYRYWPELAHVFIRRINELDETAGFPEFDAKSAVFARILRTRAEAGDPTEEERGVFYVTDEERESFRCGFVRWLGALRLRVPVCLIVNDPELLSGDGPTLAWLPKTLTDSVRVVVTSNSDRVRACAASLGWSIREFPLLTGGDVSRLLDRSLDEVDVELTESERSALLKTSLPAWPGCTRIIVRSLRECTGARRAELCSAIAKTDTPEALYGTVRDFFTADLSGQTGSIARTAMQILSCSTLGLREDELLAVVSQITPTDPAQWSEVLGMINRFRTVGVERLRLETPELREIIRGSDSELSAVHTALSRFFLDQIPAEPSLWPGAIRRDTEYAEEAVRHMTLAKHWEPLCRVLADRRVLKCLSRLGWETVRSAWMRLRLDSDVNVAARLTTLLRELIEENSPIEAIQFQIISLMEELELAEAAHDAAQLTGLSSVPTFRQPDRSRISDQIRQIWEGFLQQQEAGETPALNEKISAFLTTHRRELTDYEACRFLSLKGRCEMRLEQWERASETAEDYCRSALAALGHWDLLCAVQMRGECRYFAKQSEAAAEDLKQAAALADQIGAMREYLAALQMLAMCGFRRGDYAEAAAIMERCGTAWGRLGELRESAAVRLSLCTALRAQGKTEAALDTAREVYRDLRRARTNEYASLEISALRNIGGFCAELERYEEGEQAYLLALDRAGELSQDLNLRGVYRGLIALYRKQRFYGRAVPVCEAFAKYLYLAEAYQELASVIHEGIALMRDARYESRAESFERKWREVLSELPNNAELLETISLPGEDVRSEASLPELILAAKESGDEARCAALCAELAIRLESSDPAAAAAYFREAQNAYAAVGEADRAMDCRNDVIRLLLPEWNHAQAAAEIAQELDENSAKIVACWRSLRCEQLGREQYRAAVAVLLYPENHAAGLTEACLTDLCADLSLHCEADQLVQALACVDGSRFEKAFRSTMEKTLADEFRKLIPGLRENPTGAGADEKIRKAQKTVLLLEKLSSDLTAEASGDLARVFSRRRDAKYTAYYAQKAMDFYQKMGKSRERGAEALELVSALQSFGESERAIDLLRSELNDPGYGPANLTRAALAGKLAAMLVESEASAADEEIKACFKTEESILRTAGEERGLAVSLMNQIRYCLKTGTSESPEAVKTYDQARELVFRNRFREFYPVMQRLESVFEPGRSLNPEPMQEESEADPARVAELEDFMQRLIRTQGAYQMTEPPALVDGMIRANCALQEAIPFAEVNLLLMSPLNTSEELRCVFLMHPKPTSGDCLPALRDYVEWWNSLGSYRLRFEESDNLLSLAFVLDPREPERLNRSFHRICRLWNTDVQNVSALCAGPTDSETLRERKLSAFRRLEEQS